MADDGAAGALATFAATCAAGELPAEARRVHKALIIDAVACAAAAWVTAVPARELLVAAAHLAPGLTPGPGFLVSGRGAPAVAASVNGALIHTLVWDAAGAPGAHLGMVGFAPALAAAEALGRPVSGATLLAATAAACEVHARLVRVARRGSRSGEDGWLDGQLLGCFGACAGAGRVLGLTPVEMESAFGLSLMQASGSREVIRGGEPPVKALYGGPGNLAGVLAAYLAASGVDGRCDALHGPAGMLRGWFGCEETAALDAELGSDFQGADVHFKEWPSSGAVQPYIHVARRLRAMAGYDAAAISAVRLVAPREEHRWVLPLEERLAPRDAAVACNSIPFGLACALLTGEVTLGNLSAEGLRRADVAALLGRFEVSFVEERLTARVEVETDAGALLSTPVFTAETDNFGTLPPEQVAEKLASCNAAHPRPMPDAAVARICELVWRLEELDDVAELVALLVGS
ncbi:MAG TPA: MmgE/PrpD family protein [Acidimicrobiales bacterium]|nr:MmgE/PrpD family protein [Acidimicrobiales bacterium]